MIRILWLGLLAVFAAMMAAAPPAIAQQQKPNVLFIMTTPADRARNTGATCITSTPCSR